MCILSIELIWVSTYGNGRKIHIMGKIRGVVPVPNIAVPVQVVFYFSILTSARILTITFSFLIRFE